MQTKVNILIITQVTKNLLLKAITRTHRSLVPTVKNVVTWKVNVIKNLDDLHLTNELELCQIPILTRIFSWSLKPQIILYRNQATLNSLNKLDMCSMNTTVVQVVNIVVVHEILILRVAGPHITFVVHVKLKLHIKRKN